MNSESLVDNGFQKKAAITFFVVSAALRILLCWANPTWNSFDNHYEPIFLIMENHSIPDVGDCWQCYHPPVFYWTSAQAGRTAVNMGMSLPAIRKMMQMLCCFYGILSVGLVYLILGKLPLSGFSRLLAFGTVCFLPRHIYMSAMNSNDTMSYMFAALFIYIMLEAMERKMKTPLLLAASAVLSLAMFTKYTAYALLPAVSVLFALMWLKRIPVPRRQVLVSALIVLLIPAILLGIHLGNNMKRYGKPLPSNAALMDPTHTYPHDERRYDFITFKPWESVGVPIISPGRMHSFWTLVYTGMWFDNEPKFLLFTDANEKWWFNYFGWLNGANGYPEDASPISATTRFAAGSMIILGLFPLFLAVAGMAAYAGGLKRSWIDAPEEGLKIVMFTVLLLSNIAVMISLVIGFPIYSSMKASYLLVSTPALALFLAMGIAAFEKNRTFKKGAAALFSLIFALSAFQTLRIIFSLPW